MTSKTRNFAMLAVLAGTLVGCGGGGYVAVRNGPPPPRAAMGPRGYAPGPGYVWVDGYYDYRGRNYVWTDGGWRRPPRGRARWVPGRMERRGRGEVWIRGRWR